MPQPDDRTRAGTATPVNRRRAALVAAYIAAAEFHIFDDLDTLHAKDVPAVTFARSGSSRHHVGVV